MEKIDSFKINHLVLKRGIYVSRIDQTESGDFITTFDIRMKEPNKEPAVSPVVLHTIEHLARTFLRNHPTWKDKGGLLGTNGLLYGKLPPTKRQLQIKRHFTTYD